MNGYSIDLLGRSFSERIRPAKQSSVYRSSTSPGLTRAIGSTPPKVQAYCFSVGTIRLTGMVSIMCRASLLVDPLAAADFERQEQLDQEHLPGVGTVVRLVLRPPRAGPLHARDQPARLGDRGGVPLDHDRDRRLEHVWLKSLVLQRPGCRLPDLGRGNLRVLQDGRVLVDP